MKKYIILILFLLATSCSGDSSNKTLVFMPNEYAVSDTKDFITNINNNELKIQIHQYFPNRNNYEGSYKFKSVATKSFNSNGKGSSAILIKLDGFDNWKRKDEYINFLRKYIKSKIDNLPNQPNSHSNRKFSNGKEVKILSTKKFDFKSGEPSALVLTYETELDFTDMTKLKSEVREIWGFFMYDVENSGLKTAAIRAQKKVTDTKQVGGYGFVFKKQANGTWEMAE